MSSSTRGAVPSTPTATTTWDKLRLVDWLMVIHILSLPFLAFAPVMVAGKSIVLPYITGVMLLPALLPRRLVASKTVLVLLLWTIWVALGLSVALMQGRVTGKNVTQFANIIIMLTQFLAMQAILKSGPLERLVWMRNLFIGVSVLIALYALYEFAAGEFGLPISYSFLRNSNTYDIVMRPARTPFFLSFAPTRVMAFAPEPSLLGCYLAAVLGLMLPELMGRKRLVLRLSFAAILAALVLTFSRIGWFAVGGVLLYALVRLKGAQALRAALLVGSLLAVLIILILAGGSFNRFTTLYVDERALGNLTGFNLMLAQPIFGYGIGGYEAAATPVLTQQGVTAPLLQGAYSHSYSLYSAWGAELGVVGLLLFLGFIYALLRGLVRVQRTAPSRRVDWVTRGLEFSLIAILLGWGGTEGYNMSYLWFILAMAAALPAVSARRRRPPLAPADQVAEARA